MGNGPKSTVGPAPPEIDFVRSSDRDKNFSVGASEPSLNQVEFGLWDRCITPAGKFQNKTAEPDNFVGADSRRFYIRVRDTSAKGKGFVDVEWWTAYKDNFSRTAGTSHDDPKSLLTLFEVAGSPGVFTSRGVMLVCGPDDRNVQTDSGIPASDPKLGKQAGLRTDKQSNYRLRRAGMHGFVMAQYTPKAGKAKPAQASLPVFEKSNRKLLPVQVFILRKTAGGPPAVDPGDVCSNDMEAITETYERLGIWFWAALSDPDRAKTENKESGLTLFSGGRLSYEVIVADPPAGVNPAAVSEKTVAALGNAFPARDPNCIRLFYVEAFAFSQVSNTVLGRAFGIPPDPAPPSLCTGQFPPDPPATTGICVVKADRGDRYTAAHEIGHLLTGKSKVVVNTNVIPPACIDISHYVKNGKPVTMLLNLMGQNGALKPGIPGALHPKRIWDEIDDQSHFQLLAVRSSRFVR